MDKLYKILEQIGHFYKLKLLKLFKVHLVFYVEKLRKDLRTPLLG
jgi:hypothetical protein